MKGQILVTRDFGQSTFEISIPDDFSSPRYIVNQYGLSRYFYFSNDTTFHLEHSEEGFVNCVNDEHPQKAPFPIEITEEGIIICVNDEHLLKALFLIELLFVFF